MLKIKLLFIQLIIFCNAHGSVPVNGLVAKKGNDKTVMKTVVRINERMERLGLK